MDIFMVERSLAGISLEALGQAQAAAIAAAAASTAAGKPVLYMQSIFSPGDGRCFCMFQAESAEDVAAINTGAGLPFDRVTPAMALAAP